MCADYLLSIEPKNISPAARYVVEQLQKAGFTAYVVGGCVRDLLLGHRPKDFDVATNATPEEVLEQFRGSRIIGRRFRLVHVRKGREVIEVSTFRGSQSHPEQEPAHGNNENIFGTFEEDAFRRDFTINALYYDPANQKLLDPTERGLADLRARALVIIGDPLARFTEDPVRMIRAARFLARLDFKIDPSLETVIKQNAALLQLVAPARLFEEFLKLSLAGQSESTFEALNDLNLFHSLFPFNHQTHQLTTFERQALASTDERIKSGKSVTPAFLLAALLWDAFLVEKQKNLERGFGILDAAQAASDITVFDQVPAIAIPKRFTQTMKEIWALQDRLEFKVGRRPLRLLEHKRFRAAYDFLLLREKVDPKLTESAHWWTRVQDEPANVQRDMLKLLDRHPKQARRRKSHQRKPSPRSENLSE